MLEIDQVVFIKFGLGYRLGKITEIEPSKAYKSMDRVTVKSVEVPAFIWKLQGESIFDERPITVWAEDIMSTEEFEEMILARLSEIADNL